MKDCCPHAMRVHDDMGTHAMVLERSSKNSRSPASSKALCPPTAQCRLTLTWSSSRSPVPQIRLLPRQRLFPVVPPPDTRAPAHCTARHEWSPLQPLPLAVAGPFRQGILSVCEASILNQVSGWFLMGVCSRKGCLNE